MPTRLITTNSSASVSRGCVIGPGLVGSYLGALGGFDGVMCGASGRPAAQRVIAPAGFVCRWQPRTIRCAAEATGAGQPLLVATRTHQTPATVVAAPAALAAQNGLLETLPVAVCYMALDCDAGGALRHVGPAACPPRVVVGAVPESWRPVFARWRDAGIRVDQVADVDSHRWQKAILNATVGPLCLAHGGDMGSVWRDPALRSLVRAATGEGAILAAALGFACAETLPLVAERFFAQVGSHRPSLLRDPYELDDLLPLILRRADELGLPCPHLAEIHQRARAAVQAGLTDLDRDELVANA